MQLYKNVLQAGWNFTIHRPQLWILGLFAFFLFGLGGEIERYMRSIAGTLTSTSVTNPDFWSSFGVNVFVVQFKEQLAAGNQSVWLFFILLFVSATLVLFMMAVAQAAITYAVAHQRVQSFHTLFMRGVEHTGTVMVLTMMTMVAMTVGTLVVASIGDIIFAGASDAVGSAFVLLGAVIILAPMILGLGVWHRLTLQHIVLEKEDLWDALHSAWRMMWSHWLVLLEMTLAVFTAAVITNIAILVGTVMVFAPYLAASFMVDGQAFEIVRSDAGVTAALFYLTAMVLFSAIISTWHWAAWTELYIVLRDAKPAGTLLRWFGKK